jgi:hypothetical protein
MNVSGLNNANLEGALKAAAYLKAKNEITGGSGHFSSISQKHNTNQRMKEIYHHGDAARHMIEAALVIANKPSIKRTANEQKILNDLKNYMAPKIPRNKSGMPKPDSGGMPKVEMEYFNLYRGAISEAFKTREGKQLEEQLKMKFSHSSTYEVCNPGLYNQFGIKELPWPTLDNPDGKYQKQLDYEAESARLKMEISDNDDGW